jgi:predicted nuclease of predicted toxin-antitoxin system
MIFIDRSIPRGAADIVKRARSDCCWLEDLFAHDAAEDVWLARAGDEGWIVLTHDKKVRRRQAEREAIMEHGVGCFIFNYKQDLKKFEIAALILAVLEEIETKFKQTARPFIYTVNKTGGFKRIEP